MTIGMASGGTNQNAQLTFPALNVGGAITKVELYVEWDNSSAGEGFSASATHRAAIGANVYTYGVTGSSGSATCELVAGWSTSSSFVVDLRSSSTSTSTSKGYRRAGCYLIVTYTPFTFNGQEVSEVVYNTQPVHVLDFNGNIINLREMGEQPLSMSAQNTSKCTASGDQGSNYQEWRAFNKSYSDANAWASQSNPGAGAWIAIRLDTPVYVTQIAFRNRTRATIVAGPNSTDIYSIASLPAQGAAFAGISKTLIGTITGTGSVSAGLSTLDFDSTNSYQFLLFNPTSWDTSGGNNYVAIGEIYVYGYLDV